MDIIWGYILFSLLLFSLFSGIKASFASSGKLLFELNKKQPQPISSILTFFYKHSGQFNTMLLVGKGITLVVFGLLSVRLMTPFLISYISNSTLLYISQSLILMLLILFLGEFMPGIIVRIIPSSFSSFFAIPLFLFYVILYPIVKIITFLSWVLLRILNIKIPFNEENKTFIFGDLDNFIQQTIEDSSENTKLDNEVRFFRNALEFSQIKLKDCIVPRTEIVALETTASIDDLLVRFIETGLTKLLIYKGDIDNIVGYIHSSEMFAKPKDWTKKINPLLLVPENMAANKLMKNMLKEKKSMVVVVDEFGGTAGIVTMEDLVEEIFGEIEDEHDTNQLTAKKISENEFILSGRMEVSKVNEMFELNIPESGEYVTISGCILNQNQHFPKLNETVEIERFIFNIIKMTTTKIEMVSLTVRT